MIFTCIVCPMGCQLSITEKDGQWEVTGNRCGKGHDFAVAEATHPKRSLSSTVKTDRTDMPRLPVKTDGEIPLDLIFNVMELINQMNLTHPVKCGDILIENALDTGINIISTCDLQ